MWSNKKIYRDELICEKSCNARMVEFGVSSGTTNLSNYQTTQQLFFNNVQMLGGKAGRNFWINGEFEIQFKCKDTAAYPSSTAWLDFVKSPLWAMSCLVSINGGVNQELPLGPISAIYENYTDKYKAFPDRKIQNYYDKHETNKVSMNTKDEVKTSTLEKIHFSCPLMHPFLMQTIGQCSSLNIRISTAPGFWCLFNCRDDGTTASTVEITEAKVSISKLNLTYEEFDTADEDFANEFEYMVVYQKAYASGETLQNSDVRNVSSVPHDLFCMVARDGSIYAGPSNGNTPKTIPIQSLKIDLQNNINAYNAGNQQSIYSRCRANDYKGAYSDFVGTSDNAFSSIVRYPMRDAPVDIGTNDMFRSDFRDVEIGVYLSYATLYVVYSYKAIMRLSLKGGINAVEYTKNASEAFLGEVADGKEDDYIGGFSFSNLLNKAGKWIKNGGVSKLINTAGAVSDIIKPGNKFSGAMDKAGQIASAVGLSSSIF